MAHFVIHDLPVVAAQDLSYQVKVLFLRVRKTAQTLQKVPVHHVRNIKPQPVNAEIINPIIYGVDQMIADSRIVKVQLHKVVVAFPALIPEAVIKGVIAAEVDVEPVFIRRPLPVLQNILKLRETPAGMIEDSVQIDPDTGCVQCVADCFEVFVRSQSRVNLLIISCIVSMCVRFEYRSEIDHVYM